MTLRGSGSDMVNDVNGVTETVNIIAGTGINVNTNNASSTIQIATATSSITLDGVLNNGNTTTRSAKFLNLVTDTQPTVDVGPGGLQFGPGGAIKPGVTLGYSSGAPDGLAITNGKTLRADIIGAVAGSAIQSKSNITLDPGTTLRTDSILPTTAGASINVGNVTMNTIRTDNIQPNTLESVVCNYITMDTIKAVNESTSNSIYLNAAASVNGNLSCGSIIGTGGILNLKGSAGPGNNVVAVNAILSVDSIRENATGFVSVDNFKTSAIASAGDLTVNPTGNINLSPGGRPGPAGEAIVANAPVKVDRMLTNTASTITMPNVTMSDLAVNSVTGTASPLTIQGVPGPGSKVVVKNLNCNEAITAPGITLADDQSELKISAIGLNPGSQQITLAAGTAGVVIPYDAPLYLRKIVPYGGNGMYFDLSNSLIAPAGTGKGLTVNGISNFQNIQTNTFGADSVVTNVINTASGDLYLSPLGDVNIPTNSTLKVDNIGSSDPDNVTFFRNGLSSLQPVLLAEIESNSGDQIACNDNFGVGREYQLRVDNVVNSTDSTTGTIFVNPTNALQIAPGKPLIVDYINQGGLSNPLTLATINNQNINIYPNGTGSVYLSRPLYVPQIISNAVLAGQVDPAPLLINSPTRINDSLAVHTITPFNNGSISIIAGNSGVVGGNINIIATSGGNINMSGNTLVSGNVTTTGSIVTNVISPRSGSVNVVITGNLLTNVINPTTDNTVQINGNTTITGTVTTNNLRPQTGETISIAGGISTAGNIAIGGDLSISNVFPITGSSIQINGNATVTGNVVTNNIMPESGNTVQITGGITTTGNVISEGNIVASNISTIAADLNLAGNNINLNPSASNVVISGGSTLKVDTISQSTSSQPLTISGSNTLNIGGGVVNISGSSNRNVNITAFGTGKINLSGEVVCSGNITTPNLNGVTGIITASSQLNCNNGIVLGNGATVLNWYSESSITGTWSNVSGTPSSTFKLCRIGSIIFINITDYTTITPTGSVTSRPTFSAVIPTNFRPAANFLYSIGGSTILYELVIEAANGSITIQTNTFNTSIELIINCSYSA